MKTIDNNKDLEQKNYRIEDGCKIYMWVWETYKQALTRNIDYHLEQLWFYIWNNDWEFSEKKWDKVVEEIFEYIKEYKWKYNEKNIIKKYLQKHYPNHI
jgi:hypothetical protein